jgi:hypothetical protein
MSIAKITNTGSFEAVNADESAALDAHSVPGDTPKADGVAPKPFANKTVSVLTKGIKLGFSLAVKASLQIAKFTAIVALKVGRALAGAIKNAYDHKASGNTIDIKPKRLLDRKPTSVKQPKPEQKNLAFALRDGGQALNKSKAAQKDRSDIAALERRAKALKQDDVESGGDRNQDYTNFEHSSSTLSANANLTAKDRKDISELEKRLNELKKP